jgi:hypothetical protein
MFEIYLLKISENFLKFPKLAFERNLLFERFSFAQTVEISLTQITPRSKNRRKIPFFNF